LVIVFNKMKYNCFIVFFSIICFTSTIAVAQSEESEKTSSHSLEVTLGAHYNRLFGNRYIEPCEPSATCFNKFAGFTIIPNISFHGGLNYSYNFYKNLYITLGIMYYNRRMVLKNSEENTLSFD